MICPTRFKVHKGYLKCHKHIFTRYDVCFLSQHINWEKTKCHQKFFFNILNERKMHLYSAFCVLLHTQSALQSCGGVSPQPPPVCSIHLDDATAATGQRRQCAHHTPATGGEEREIEPIKCMIQVEKSLILKFKVEWSLLKTFSYIEIRKHHIFASCALAVLQWTINHLTKKQK